MLLASSSYSYPVLGAFWTIFMIFLWVIWFWILITIFIDLFRSHDLSGWVKALWFIFILIFPLIGVLVYLIARGGLMVNASIMIVLGTKGRGHIRHKDNCQCRQVARVRYVSP